MLDAQVVNAFLIIASVCIIVLTVLFAAGAIAALFAIQRARRFIGRLESEAEQFAKLKERITGEVRFAGKWARILGRHIIHLNR